MSLTFSPRDRRALAVGGVAAALILSYAFLIRPLAAEARRLDERRDLAAATLERYRGAAAAEARLVTGLGQLVDRSAAASQRFYRAPRPEAAVGRFLDTLQKAAAGNRVRVLRAVPLPADSVAPGVRRIGASLDAESDFRGILGFLRSLESAGMLFHVSGLSITRAGDNTGEMERLRVSMAVHGFVIEPDESDEPDARAGEEAP